VERLNELDDAGVIAIKNSKMQRKVAGIGWLADPVFLVECLKRTKLLLSVFNILKIHFFIFGARIIGSCNANIYPPSNAIES